MARRAVDASGDMALVGGRSVFAEAGADETGQRWSARLRLFSQEWFRDLNLGFPWAEVIASRRIQVAREYITRWSAQTLGVKSVDGISLEVSAGNRAVTGRVAMTVESGEQVGLTLPQVVS